MKKVLAFGVIGLIGLWIVGVFISGRAAANKVDEQIAELNSDLADRSIPVSVSKQSYESGFFSSDSRIQVTMDYKDKRPVLIEVDLDIYHGPIMLPPDGPKLGAYYIGFTPDIAAALSEAGKNDEFLNGFAGRDPLTGGVLMGFWGGQTIDLALAPFEFSEDGSSFSLENGIVGSFSTDGQFSTLAGNVEFGALSFGDESEAATFYIAASNLTADITEIHAGSMLTGELAYRLDRAVIKAEGAEHRIEDVFIRALSDKNESGIYGNAEIVAGSISSSDQSFKSMFNGPLTARLHMDYEGLDEPAFREYMVVNQRMNQGVYTAFLWGGDTSRLTELYEEEMQNVLHATAGLIKKGFKFDYGISVGGGDASSGFKLSADWVDDQDLVHKETLRQALAGIQAKLNVTIDKAFLSGDGQIMQIPVGMGYAVETPTGFASEAEFNRGELSLNGQAIPYTQMLGSALDQELPWRER